MSDQFVISDNHYYHYNIIRYCGRKPADSMDLFPDVETMNEYMVWAWNSVVKPSDTVWHLGDIALCQYLSDLTAILSKLNGKINLIIGNHDKHSPMIRSRLNNVGLKSVSDHPVFLDSAGIILSHYPIQNPRYLNCHGHIHNKNSPSPFHFNACVEKHNYVPVHFDVIMQAKKRSGL